MRVWLAVVVGVAAGCGSSGGETPPPPATVSHPVAESQLPTVTLSADAVARLGIETAVIRTVPATATRTVGGEVIAPPGRAVVIVAPGAGTILAPEEGRIPVAGARVGQGEPLVRLLALPPDQSSVREAAAVAEARLTQAVAESNRVEQLFAEGLVSGRERERAAADLAAARAAAEGARAQRVQIEGGDTRGQGGLAPLVLTAPNASVVRAVNVAAGQAVPAGAVLIDLVSLDRLWVRVPVYAGDARDVAPGQPARVAPLGAAPGRSLRATPVQGPPVADAAAASVDLYYEIQGPAAFRPGERVRVDLPVGGRSDSVAAAPLAAIIYDARGGTWVYERLDSLVFVRRRVDLVRITAGVAMFARGPAAGARVVTAGAAELFGTEFGAGK